MTIKSSKFSLTARLAVTGTVAAAALVATATPSSAAALSLTATPSTGAVSTVISLTTTTAYSFKTAGGTLKIANQTTPGTVDKNAVILSTAACATAAGAIPATTRTITDGVTSTNTALTSATAAFVGGDVGKAVTGAGIAAGTTISSVTNATTVVLSQATTATATGVSVAIGAAAGPFQPALITVVSGTKLVVKAPSVMTAGAYNVCVYDNGVGAAAQVMGKATYTVYAAPTLNTVTPNSGPTAGGTAITIDGTGFTAKTTATIGGVALTVKLATGSTTSLTATVPAHGPGAVPIVVTTEGGPTLGVNFTYKDGITVTPTTMVGNDDTSTTPQVLDITGAGFSDATTGFDFTTPTSKVFLVQVPSSGTVPYNSTTPNDKAVCTGVVPISDLELICTLDPTDATSTAAVAPKNGAYQVVIVKDPADDTKRETIVTSGSTFTIAPY